MLLKHTTTAESWRGHVFDAVGLCRTDKYSVRIRVRWPINTAAEWACYGSDRRGVSLYFCIFHPSGNSPHVLFKRGESNEGFKTESHRDRGFRKVTLVESGALFQAVRSSAPSPSKSWHTQRGERHKHCLVSSLRGENQGRNDCRVCWHQSPGICRGGKNISGFGSLKATRYDETSYNQIWRSERIYIFIS